LSCENTWEKPDSTKTIDSNRFNISMQKT